MKNCAATWMPCVAVLLTMTACSKQEPVAGRPWRAFVADLTNLTRLAEANLGGTRLISSFDPTGGNDDFNHFKAPGSEPGWVTLANLKGPGVIRRFWTTGVDPGHPFKLYFDGEKKPRLSGTIDELFGERFPFQPPLARTLNYCWSSYVPLTFQSSIRIETLAPPTHPLWGQRRLFYQFNVESFTNGQAVQTFPRVLTPEDTATLNAVNQRWLDTLKWPTPEGAHLAPITVETGQQQNVFQSDRPGQLSEWWLDVKPAAPEAWTQLEMEKLLQDVVLRVQYDGQTAASVEVPLGDFFANAWRTRYYNALALGSGPRGFRCAFPMPFRRSCVISISNGTGRAVTAQFHGNTQALGQDNPLYFHAEYRRSGPANGKPHRVLDLKGRGRFVGCFLGITGHGVTQQDNSWWLLEGDETMYVDGETRPSWHGTGLEDYFNGGWYYRNAAFSACFGILDRSPFRVAQYRHQLVDPVAFDSSFNMQWERGDQNVSYAWFQSVAYFYMEQPQPVQPVPAERTAVVDRYARQTMMLQLMELERMNNFQKAIDLIREYRERFPDAEENKVYALRTLEYRRLLGEAVTEGDYAPYLNGEGGPTAAEQAKLLTWFHAATNRALIALNANAQAKLYLDAQPLLSGDHPLQLFVTGVELNEGPHVLAAEASMVRQEPWVQMAVRTHGGLVGSGLGTPRSRQVKGNWNALTGDATAWKFTPAPDLIRGNPDAPFIGSVPNAFVLLGAKAYAVRGEDWGYYKGTAYFRLDFTAPLQGLPSTARDTTGLQD